MVPGDGRFPSTRWSLVVAAAHQGTPDGSEALASICSAYWYPLYAFVRRSGRDPASSEDLTQAYFTRLLEKQWLRQFQPERGRLRTFLLVSLKHFINNEWAHDHAQKRGGLSTPVPLDRDSAEEHYRREPADPLTPERIFERRWALTVVDHAMARLRQHCLASGKGEQFERLQSVLTGDAGPDSYRLLSEELGMSEGAVRVAIHRLRRRFASLVREEIAQTVSNPSEVEGELRYLTAVLNG
jgi:RNA polymerase sigma factor (sigma-70 family)